MDMPGKHGGMCGTNHGRQDAQIEIACLHWLDFFFSKVAFILSVEEAGPCDHTIYILGSLLCQ